jgi:nicotinamidase/pyrazinamidase
LKGRKALLVVDIQRDFCPGGALPVEEGDRVVGPVNALIRSFGARGLPVFFTRDWHPEDHVSFRSRGGPWPPHCVKNTPGAEFHPALDVPKGAEIVSKGTEKDVEAYSGFQGTALAERLKEVDVESLCVTGLATDYCVKNTVLDALALGYSVEIPVDCTRGVNVASTDSAKAMEEMVRAGARKTSSVDILKG